MVMLGCENIKLIIPQGFFVLFCFSAVEETYSKPSISQSPEILNFGWIIEK